MKQARAYGVGVLVATQNPMDLDYRVLSNAGVWFVGRLQTDTDRARVVEAMSSVRGAGGFEPDEVADAIKRLAPRWFVARNAVPGAGRGALAVEDDAVVAARADDARGSAPRAGAGVGEAGAAQVGSNLCASRLPRMRFRCLPVGGAGVRVTRALASERRLLARNQSLA